MMVQDRQAGRQASRQAQVIWAKESIMVEKKCQYSCKLLARPMNFNDNDIPLLPLTITAYWYEDLNECLRSPPAAKDVAAPTLETTE